MQSCLNCKFYGNEQKVMPNHEGVAVIAQCKLFNIQIVNQHVDSCTGMMPKEANDARINEAPMEVR